MWFKGNPLKPRSSIFIVNSFWEWGEEGMLNSALKNKITIIYTIVIFASMSEKNFNSNSNISLWLMHKE